MSQLKLKKRLGDLLVEHNIITEPQLMQALSEQRSSGRKLGATLVALGMLTEEEMLGFLAKQLDIPLIDINEMQIDPAVTQLLPEVQARRLRALVIEDDGQYATVAVSDPADITLQDTLFSLLPTREITFAIVREVDLLAAFDRLYRRTHEIASFAEQLKEEQGEEEQDDILETLGNVDEGSEEATVAKLLHSLFEDAVQIRASDIHIEPDEKVLRIRQRIDGILHESVLNEVAVAPAMVLRLKLMSGLDISEKRLPQDGRFHIKVRGHAVDVRVSTMPTQYGESVVMRLLDQTAGLLNLDDVGMSLNVLSSFRNQLSRPHGIILVTGPTGSGKTTTLYGALSELNQPEKKIITVEDPVEYRLPRINQVQVNGKIGLDFAKVLRTTLRQDPDIIMVGEMRDQETVEIGLRGALTGHLVLSTLHTNDAVTTALRLMDMGAPGFLVGSALRAVIAQRLVRKVCPHCSVPDQPDSLQKTWLASINMDDVTSTQFVKGNGCQRCSFTGYSGRMGVFELLVMDEAMMEALRREDNDAFIQAALNSEGYIPLAEAALAFAREGKTTLEEVMRLTEFLGSGLSQPSHFPALGANTDQSQLADMRETNVVEQQAEASLADPRVIEWSVE